MVVYLVPTWGYMFDENPTVYFNGDPTVYNPEYSGISDYDNDTYMIYTIEYILTPPTSNITEIYVNGYTAPAWGAHPDFDLTVPSSAHYSIDGVIWIHDEDQMEPGDVFVDEFGIYYMLVYIAPEEGYAFDPDATVYFNGESSINDAAYNSILSDGTFKAYTIDYQVFPNSVNESSATALSVYPNPAMATLRVNGLETKTAIEIYNSLGEMVKTMNVTSDKEINIGDLAPGVYMLRCGNQIIRIVKE